MALPVKMMAQPLKIAGFVKSTSVHKQDKKHFSGAGVLLVDAKHNQIILGKDQTKEYRDLGGGRDHKETCPQCASREACEESKGTINISIEHLKNTPHVDIPAGNTWYRCYIYRIRNFSCRDFYNVPASKLKIHQNELTRLTRFPLDDIKNRLQKNPIEGKILTDKNVEEPIGGRVRRVLREAIAKRLL